MDISAVAACLRLTTDPDTEVVTDACFAFGGMAATTSRATHAEQAVLGKPWNEDTVRVAMDALAHDFTPLSDHRGSDWYRSTLARNLLLGCYVETLDTGVVRMPDLPCGTVVLPEARP